MKQERQKSEKIEAAGEAGMALFWATQGREKKNFDSSMFLA